ncbi:MAG: 16S rRNA (guanine(527)-N(7))-methyltransferase RsmG [Bacteroidia bacterium]|nr:16S rRNA (guanine(527)-N(7))-methyltransferase RsmG [Bacteroidia bacterium]
MGHSFLYKDYLPELQPEQEEKLHRFKSLFLEWNSRINLISRKDTDSFEVKHVLHSLAISRFIRFYPGARVLDLGTGGGFPGIPLAILNPQCRFILVDSIEKKVKAVHEMIQALSLQNAEAKRSRVEELEVKVDYVVSRAVAPMPDLVKWTRNVLQPGQMGSLPNGWLVLKGGDLKEELQAFGKSVEIQQISDWFKDPFFETKVIVYLARQIL